MFGYVRPRKDELKIKDYDAYQAAYCGLCRALGKQYGFAARMLVNYDMTFLYLLRAGLDPACASRRCFCPARVVRRKTCLCDEGNYSFVTAVTVILTYEKLADTVRDSGFFRAAAARIGKRLLRGAYRKAAKRLPAFSELAAEKLAQLQALEQENCGSIDAASDAFASIVSGCAADLEDASIRRPMQAVLYQVGRFIYLADALDDLAEDCRRDRYNPLRFRFFVSDGKLSGEDLEYLSQLTDTSVNLAGSALSLLPLKTHSSLLENIIFLGLPAVFSAVRQGSFRAGSHI